MMLRHFFRSSAKLTDSVAFTRSSAAALSITIPAQGVALQPFCGAVTSTSMPSARMSSHAHPDAMQSMTSSPPTSCVASASCLM